MKLLVITSRGNIVGITESKKTAKRFAEERSKCLPQIHKVEKKSIIDNILTNLNDYNIEEEPLLEILITERESRLHLTKLNEEYDRIKTTLRDMKIMVNNYGAPFHINKKLEKGIEGLQELSNPVMFGHVMGIDILIAGLHSAYNPLDKYLN